MGTDIHGVFQRRTDTGWEDIPSKYEENRHYQLFAVLAGVRNGFGFAGCPTGDAVNPISEPRGLPHDFAFDGNYHPVASIELMGYRGKYHQPGEPLRIWMCDHSHSWLTGAEMLAWVEKAPVITKTGVLSREEYDKWDKRSAPDTYCGAVMGPGLITVSDNAIEMGTVPHWTHVQCEWESSLRSELSYFFDEVARLTAEHGEVRSVFGFDS